MTNTTILMKSNREVREHYDNLMMQAFTTAVEQLGKGAYDEIGMACNRFIREQLCEQIALWLKKVGMVGGPSASYCSMANNEIDELISIFFSANCINNRLAHYLMLTENNGAYAALKSLQTSANNVALDCLPYRKGNRVTNVDMETVEGTLAAEDCDRPDRAAESRQNMAIFWKLLCEKEFDEIVTFLSIPLAKTRNDLADSLLDRDAIYELLDELEDYYATLLSDVKLVRLVFRAISDMADAYEPAPEYVRNPKALVNKLYRYTGKGTSALVKFSNEFKAAIAS